MTLDTTLNDLRESLITHWFTTRTGWSIVSDSDLLPHANLVTRDPNGYHYATCFANDRNAPMDSVSLAIGRLVLMMNRPVSINSLGLPVANADDDPPLIRYVLAVPDEPTWLDTLRLIPDHARILLNLVLVTARYGAVTEYLPSVQLPLAQMESPKQVGR
jgi:hypothetical protein